MCSTFLAPTSFCESESPACPKLCHESRWHDQKTALALELGPVLPALDPRYADDVEVYMPGLDDACSAQPWMGGACKPDNDYSCDPSSTYDQAQRPNKTDPAIKCDAESPNLQGSPAYMTFTSKKLRQPILSAYITAPGAAIESSRGCDAFQTCCVNGVTQRTYSNTGLDRGHQVSASELNREYAESITSFSMCNIGPQSSRLNQKDWLNLEILVYCVGLKSKFVELSGPLFTDPFADADTRPCMCPGMGVGACNECTGEKGVPLPQAYWKMIVFTGNGPRYNSDAWETYLWIFDTAQAGCAGECQVDMSNNPYKTNPLCSMGAQVKGMGATQSICEAYAVSGFARLRQSGLLFPPLVIAALQPDCTPLNALAQGCGMKGGMAFCADSGGAPNTDYYNAIKYTPTLTCKYPGARSKYCCKSDCEGKAAGDSDGCGRMCDVTVYEDLESYHGGPPEDVRWHADANYF